ncbi:MAG: hypothetical protein Kow0029_17540 [Candidatus Rifleibacteriota bacterium]
MKSYRKLSEHSWLLIFFVCAVAFMSAGCASSTTDSSNVNPLGAYQITTNTGGLNTDGTVTNPGAIDSPIISTPTDGSSSINGHDNAPLLNNMHPGWQQADCLSCHDSSTRNPDHYYTDASMCYLCHGTNGLPGFGDNIPPVLSGVVTTPTDKSVLIVWTSNEPCLSRLVLRTIGGDRLEFPVSTSYSTSHRYEITGLLPTTTYTYELICTDKSGNRTTSASFGTLSFTTTEKQADVNSVTTTNPESETFFTGVNIAANGSFKVDVKFTVAEPSIVFAYFVYADNNQLATSKKLNDLTNGQLITTFDQTLVGLDAGTTYKVYLEAKDQADKVHKSKTYTVKTDAFDT